jgi:hypothetical protein
MCVRNGGAINYADIIGQRRGRTDYFRSAAILTTQSSPTTNVYPALAERQHPPEKRREASICLATMQIVGALWLTGSQCKTRIRFVVPPRKGL